MVDLAQKFLQAIARVLRRRPRGLQNLVAGFAFAITCAFVVWVSPLLPSAAQSEASLIPISTEPADGATDVLVNSDTYIQFNQPLSGDFEELQILFDPPVELSFATQDDYLVLQPIEQWDYSTTYEIDIPPQPSLPIAESFKLTFSTEPEYTYDRDIKPLIDTSCVACHQPAGRQRSSPLDTYSSVLKYVQPGAASSVLIDPKWTGRHARIRQTGRSLELAFARARNISVEKITNGWSSDEIEKVTTWIVQDGAVESTTARQ